MLSKALLSGTPYWDFFVLLFSPPYFSFSFLFVGGVFMGVGLGEGGAEGEWPFLVFLVREEVELFGCRC